MFISRHILNPRRIAKTIFFIVIFLCFVLLNIRGGLNDVTVKLNDIALTYNGSDIAQTSSDSEDVISGLETYHSTIDNTSYGTLNTNVVNSKSLVEFRASEESIASYISENSVYLTDGYLVTIDDRNIFIDDKSYIDWAQDTIIEELLDDDSLYALYQSNGQIPAFDRGGKSYSGFRVVNDISITNEYVPASKIISSKEDFLYILLHGDDEKEVATLDADNSIGQIQKEHKLSDVNFNLNNPTISNDQLLTSNDEIVVNKLNPIIDVAYSYTFTRDEVIEYTTEYVDDPTLPEGQNEVLNSGSNGEEIVTYETEVLNSQELSTSRIASNITVKPVNEKIAEGTKYIPSMGGGNWYWPGSSHTITNGFYGWSGIGEAYHGAIDIQAWYGAPVYAADNGVVTRAGWGNATGINVAIDHNNGYQTKYYHMSSVAVSPGQTVSRGQLIGYEGATGFVTGEHLHFEIIENGVRVNPLNYY